jgi:hypothetical protein
MSWPRLTIVCSHARKPPLVARCDYQARLTHPMGTLVSGFGAEEVGGMEDFVIRPALLEDIDDVQQLSLQAFQHECDHGFDRHLNLHWPRSAGAQALFRRLIEQEDSLLLVAARPSCGFSAIRVCSCELRLTRYRSNTVGSR